MTLKSFYPSSFENFSIKELGLKLSPSERLRIKNRLSILEQKTPAYSSISLRYHQINFEKNAELSIQCGDQRFSSRSNGQDIFEMYLEMEQDIEEQLLFWKKKRHLNTINQN